MEKIVIKKNGLKLTQEEDIVQALDSVNGKACNWVIDTIKEVVDIAERAEVQFDEVHLPKTYRVGATAKAYGYAPGKSYKYGVDSTEIELRRFAEGWRIMNVDRIKLYPADSRASKVKISLTVDQMDKVKEIIASRFDVQPEQLAA